MIAASLSALAALATVPQMVMMGLALIMMMPVGSAAFKPIEPATLETVLQNWCTYKKNNDTALLKDLEDLYGTISEWDTSDVVDMSNLFQTHQNPNDVVSENCDMAWMEISKWNTAKVTNMGWMFGHSKFSNDISEWNTAKVNDMTMMFWRSQFNNNISKWNTAKVTAMDRMFRLSKFNNDISEWNTAKVNDMYMMFDKSNFNSDISEWNTAKVTSMLRMFRLSKFNNDISEWNTANVKNMREMFDQSNFNNDISKWNTAKLTNMRRMFRSFKFDNDISEWNTANVDDMKGTFQNANLAGVDLSSWNTSKVTCFQSILDNATSFDLQMTAMWDTSAVTSAYCKLNLTLYQPCPAGYTPTDKLFGSWEDRCELPVCSQSDSSSFQWDDRKDRNCSWIGKKPAKRCFYAGAKVACAQSCCSTSDAGSEHSMNLAANSDREVEGASGSGASSLLISTLTLGSTGMSLLLR